MTPILSRTSIGLALASLLFTSGCANLSTHDRNLITGASVGAVTGAVLTGGSSVGVVGGGAIGGYIGDQIGRRK